MNTSKILTIDATAEYLHINKATLWRWRKAGKGPAYIKRGGRYYYKLSDIRSWLHGGDQ